MREIKFRAWDKKTKTMRFVDAIEWNVADLDKQKITRVKLAFYKRPFWRWRDIKDVILMQYTGLKDKHGEGIYEGDLICHPFEAEYSMGIVKINQGHWSIGNPKVEGHYDLEELYEDDWAKCEIIGNIYENRGLLKGDK